MSGIHRVSGPIKDAYFIVGYAASTSNQTESFAVLTVDRPQRIQILKVQVTNEGAGTGQSQAMQMLVLVKQGEAVGSVARPTANKTAFDAYAPADRVVFFTCGSSQDINAAYPGPCLWREDYDYGERGVIIDMMAGDSLYWAVKGYNSTFNITCQVTVYIGVLS